METDATLLFGIIKVYIVLGYAHCTLLEVQEMAHNFTNKLNYNPIAAKHVQFSF